MPKRKPDKVVVHRIELQEKERQMLQVGVIGKTVSNLLIPVGVITGVGAASYIGYKYFKSLSDWGEDIVDELQEILNTDVNFIEGAKPVPLVEAVLGKKTHTDSEGNVYKNPVAMVPILGPLFSSAINIEIAARKKLDNV